MRIYLLLLLIICPNIAESQTTFFHNDSNNSTVKSNIKKDTVIIFQKIIDDDIRKNYEEILEKTNSQLSLWWNPYGIFIAMLGILFTVLAIVASFVIYRQGKEHKELIKNSLEDHKSALDKLLKEKYNQLKFYDFSLDKSILEFKEKYKMETEENKKLINKFILKLEEQKNFIQAQTHTIIHAGWEPKDIPENHPINLDSIFSAQIVLNEIGQSFFIYIRVTTSDNKLLWLGFGGNNGKNVPYIDNNEFTLQQTFETKVVEINENIVIAFRRGFPSLKTQPKEINLIRIRASNSDLNEITFRYKMS